MNLLSNAAKFVGKSGGHVRVGLTESVGESLTVEVADNGPGILTNEQATVFEKFRQVGDMRAKPAGTGLGLPISRQIVEHFGGRMWVESVPGEGATFYFRLPLARSGG